MKRYDLNNPLWSRLAVPLPGTATDPVRLDNQLFVDGCLRALRSRAHSRELSERNDRWKTVHRRFSCWCHTGVWKRSFEALTADRDNHYLMIDSTIVRAHSRPPAEYGRQRPDMGLFPRWIDDENPPTGRHSWPAFPYHCHNRDSWETSPRFQLCWRASAAIPSNRPRKPIIPHDGLEQRSNEALLALGNAL